MSELQDAKQQSREEEDLRNLLNVQYKIDDALHEIDEVVNTTENDLFYVSAHEVNGKYSKLLDELIESHLSNSNNGKNYNPIGKDERQSTGLVVNIGMDEGLQLCSEPPENSNHLVLSVKQADFETVISTESGTASEQIKVCSENQRYFSNIGGSPLQNRKSDTGLKRPIVSSPKEELKTNGETIRNICKKLKADSPNEFFNIHTIHQKRPTNMGRKLTCTNFRGPIGISFESIAVILDTKKPATCYRYPARKPEYGVSRMSAGKLKRASQQISVTVCSMREYRKVIAYPYVDDYIELTDTFLAQELEEEYKNIVRSDCSNTVDEAHNFMNSPNRTIKLIESSSASSVEDFFDTKINKIKLNNAKSEENSENKQRNGSFKDNLWNNISHPPCVQTEQENRDSRLFSEIVPLPIQIDVEMLNIGKNTNYDEENLTQFHSNKNNSNNQDDPLLDPLDPTESSSECISCELSLYSPIKLTPSTSPVYRNATLETDLKSDLLFNHIHKKDQNDMSDILETDDAEGKKSMSICNAKTFNKTNRAGLVEKQFKKKFEISTCESNTEETNALDIDQNFYFGSDSIGNNSKQISEVDDNPLPDSNIFDTCSISTITANNGFDSDSGSGSMTTDSSKTTRHSVYENFALGPTKRSTNSEGIDIESSLTIQNGFDFNESVNFIGTENAFCNQNVDNGAMISFKSFEFAAATLKNTENRSSDNQDEDVVVASDISITSREDAFEFKNQNTAKLISSKDGDTVVLSDSDNENRSCRTESAEECKQSKVTINVTSSDDDLSPDFIPFKKYKLGSEYNQDEDVISISSSSSHNEYFEAENAIAQKMYNTSEESIAKCELNQDDMYVSEYYKLDNKNATPVETKNSKTTNAATFKLSYAENVIDLIDSSLDSVISINSDDALVSSPEESINKSLFEGPDKCTNTSSAVSNSSNHNTVPLITHGINFKNYKESISDKNQSINFNGNIENEFLSHTKGNNFFYENNMTEQHQSSAAVSTITTTSTTISYLDSRSSDNITFFNSNNNSEQACEDVQKDESNIIFNDDVRVGDNGKELCNTENLHMNEKSFSRPFSEDCNKNIRVKNVTVPEAEGYISSISCTVECKEVDNVCASQTNSPKDETSMGSLVNGAGLFCIEAATNDKSTILSDQNIFTSIYAENPPGSSNNQNNTKDVSTSITTETENGVNPIMNPKCIIEQFKILDRITSPHDHVRVGDDTKMGLCNTEDLLMNENSFSRRFLEGCNKIIRDKNMTVSEAEGSISSTSCTVECKEVDSVCSIYQPDSPKGETSVGSLVVDTLVCFEGATNGKSTVLPDQNIFTSIHAENPSNSLDNQNNIAGVSTFVQNTETKNSENPIIKPKFIVEQFEQVDDLTPSLNRNENISNISSYSSSAVSNVEIFQNSDIKHQNNISPEFLLVHNNSSTPPLVSEQIENTMHDTTNLLELPYINSEIGMRCILSNYTSHTVPDLDLNNSSQTYVPAININSDFIHKCDDTVDVNRNCTVTSECLMTDVCQDNDVCNTTKEFVIFNCDKSKEGQINLKTSDLTVQKNSGLQTASNTPSSLNTCSTTTLSQAVLKTSTEAHDNSSKLNVAASPIHTVHANKIITGVKRPLAYTTSNKTNKRCKPSSTNITHQAQPSTSKTTPVGNHSIDAKEIADNNDPKWKLFNFSEPHDFFLATRNQWCAPMPNPHVDLTRRHCTKKPTNISRCIIPGDQKALNVECLRVYEEQLHEINTKSANLKHELDMYGQCWNQRRINQTLNQLRHLDNMHDVLREAWDDAYHFYVYSKTSETDQGAWCMSKFNQNEIARSLEMIRAYDMYYGHSD